MHVSTQKFDICLWIEFVSKMKFHLIDQFDFIVYSFLWWLCLLHAKKDLGFNE